MEPYYSRLVNKRKDKRKCFSWEDSSGTDSSLSSEVSQMVIKTRKGRNILFCNPSFLIQKDNTGLRKSSLKKDELIPGTFR